MPLSGHGREQLAPPYWELSVRFSGMTSSRHLTGTSLISDVRTQVGTEVTACLVVGE